MNYKRCGNKVIVRIDKGEEIVDTLKSVCKKLNITLGTITGIGATDKLTVGFLNTKTKKYLTKELTGDHEIAPLTGTITTMNSEPYLHLHINVCNEKQQSFGGHLASAVVSVTFEGIIDIIEGTIERTFDHTTGANLLKL
jgi:predicted DNA-binding protein with PD1-like motif